jgi:hypothetical protein
MTPSRVGPTARSVSGLELRLKLVDGVPSLRPVIDGEDLLSGYANSEGRDPDELLPPLSGVLLPTAIGRRALIGSCGCGEIGCGALAVLVRRDRATVTWGPVSSPGPETLSRTYRFELEQYLDAIDGASRDRPGEGRGRALARTILVGLRDYDDRYGKRFGADIDWVSGGRWGDDDVQASLSTDGGQEISTFAPDSGESDEQFASRVVSALNQQRTVAMAARQEKLWTLAQNAKTGQGA